MNTASLIEHLRGSLSNASLAFVVSALRQDPTVWESLHDAEFWQLITAQERRDPEDWSPAALALTALQSENDSTTMPFSLQADIQFPLDSSLRRRAARAYEALTTGEQSILLGCDEYNCHAPSVLAHSALLALALRERRRLTGSWNKLTEELAKTSCMLTMGRDWPGENSLPDAQEAIYLTWRTPLACLYGMVPDSFKLLHSLLTPPVETVYHALVVHLLLSNPLPPEKVHNQLRALISALPLADSIQLLDQYSRRRPAAAGLLADELVNLNRDSDLGSTRHQPVLPAQADYQVYLKQLGELLQLARINQLAEKPVQVLPYLNTALEASNRLQAELASLIARNAAQRGDTPAVFPALKQAANLAPDNPVYQARLIIAQRSEIITESPSDPDELIPDLEIAQGVSPHPALLLAATHLTAKNGNIEKARSYASALLDQLSEPAEANIARAYLTSSKWLLGENNLPGKAFITLLLDLGLPDGALECVKLLSMLLPDDPQILTLQAKAQADTGNVEEAINSLVLALALDTNQPDLHRQLAGYYERQGVWQSALQEYSYLLDDISTSAPTPDDFHNLSFCALRANEPQKAASASEYALNMDPEDGLAHCYLGQSLALLGDQVRAEEHLTLSTQYAPALAETWLNLARLQKVNGHAPQALETLRAGSLAAVEDPDLFFELGEAYMADWEGHGHSAPTQAVSMFQHAYDLSCTKLDQNRFNPSQMQIALRLGQTLLELGHTQEARDVLELAFKNDATYPGLARSFARALLAVGEPDQALPALKIVIDSNNGDLDDYLDYGRALISIHRHPEEAVRALKQVIAWSPGHAQATGLLAEALAASGDHEAALDAFQNAMETSLVDDPAWSSRLSLGLGKTALALGQPEIAMAALQEAAQADPSNPQIQCNLAEAYEAGSLISSALQAARIALRLDPDEVDTLVWFAEKAVLWTNTESGDQVDSLLGATGFQIRSEAVNALRRATQLDPSRTDLLVKLGKTQCLIGELAAADETFRQLITINEVPPDDLHQAAISLLELGDAVNAVACLEHALLVSRGSAFVADGPGSLPYTLIDAYMAAGNPQAALKTVEQVLAISEKDLAMFRYKTRLLLEMGRLPEALACLESALEMEPQGEFTGQFHYQAALVQRALGNLQAARAHLDKVLATPDAKPLGSVDPAARVLAAELSFAMLEPDKACALLGIQVPTGEIQMEDKTPDEKSYVADSSDSIETSFNGLCLRAELALDLGEELQMAEEAARTAKSLVDHSTQQALYRPRLLAVQSRILARHGESSQALVALKQAIAMHEGMPDELSTTDPFKKLARSYQQYTQSLASAALELAQWEPAQFLWRQVIDHAPQEPLPHLYLAATLVCRAEAQCLCDEVDLVNHTPGKSALTEHAHQNFNQEINCAATCCPIDPNNPLILRWRARGQAIFEPTAITAQLLATLPIFPHSPEDVAAHIANLRRINENLLLRGTAPQDTNLAGVPLSPAGLAAQVARAYPQHPLVLAQLALTLAAKSEYIKDALTAAQAAIKAQVEKGTSYPPASWLPPVQEGSPAVLVYAMLASIAFKAGDLELANQAIETALAGWFDEPRWQALAANIQNARSDVNLMVTHLEQASTLDPENLAYLMALGEAYQVKAQNQQVEGEENPLNLAIRTFEKATNLAPDEVDPWLALAGAHRQADDLVHAASCAEQAIRLAPDQAQPLLVRAEIALQAGDALQAHDRAQAAVLLGNSSDTSHKSTYKENISNPVLLLARSLISLDRPEEALEILEKTLPTAQEPLPLLLERVQLLRKARGAQVANEALNDLSQHFPDEPLVLAPLAKVMAENNQTDSAIKLAQRCLQASVAQAAVRGDHLNLDIHEQVEMHILLGRLLRQVGQLDQALHHLNEAIHLDPQLLEPYLELGRAHQERRQLTQALQVYNEATSIAPKDPRPYFQAGLALKESKDYLGAENMLRRAAALAPNDLSIHRQLGAVVALNLVHNRRRTNVDL